jgi:hypothetical protein
MEHSKICEAMNRVILDQGNSILKSHLPCHIHHLIINQATISLLLEEVNREEEFLEISPWLWWHQRDEK